MTGVHLHTRVEQIVACPSCGGALAGPFCHHCGETRPDPHDFTWKHTVHDAVHEFLHLDGKILTTLWLLIRRPGFLTLEYWEGACAFTYVRFDSISFWLQFTCLRCHPATIVWSSFCRNRAPLRCSG